MKAKKSFGKHSRLDNKASRKPENIIVIQKKAAIQTYVACLFEKLPHFSKEDENNCKISTKKLYQATDFSESTEIVSDEDWEEQVFSEIGDFKQRIDQFINDKSPTFVCKSFSKT